MNEYTEFDTAAEMQKALDRKKAAYGVPYEPLTETCEVDEVGIIRDVDEVNTILGKDEKPSFAHEIAIMLIIASMFTYIGITNVRNGDAKAAAYAEARR